MQDVFILPLVLATTSVFPDALGVGFSRSQVIMSLFPSIFVSIAMCHLSVLAPHFYPEQLGTISIEGLVNNDNQTIQSLNSFLVSLSTNEKIRCMVSRARDGLWPFTFIISNASSS